MSDALPIHVINMDDKPERMEHMAAELSRLGLSFERFPAIGPDTVPNWLRPQFYDSSGAPHGPLSPGEIGCYASHLVLMERVARTGAPALILEDDLRLADAFGRITTVMAHLPKDCGFLRLSNPTKSACRMIAETPLGMLVEYWRPPNNMGAYVATPLGARLLLDFCATRMRAIDEDVRRPWETGAVSYGLLPALAEVNAFDASGISAMGGRKEIAGRRRFRGSPPGRRLGWLIRRWGMKDSLRAMLRKGATSVSARLGRGKPAQRDFVL